MSVSAFIGCMFSGKTSRMLLEGERQQRSGKSVLYLKSSRDMRYSSDINLTCSHDGVKVKSIAVPDDDLSKIRPMCDYYQVICIDEAQFMNNLLEFCEEMATKRGKTIFLAALDGDFNRNPFPNVAQILSRCEVIKKLQSICVECGADASFTRKVGGSKEVIVEVGGSDLYIPVCRAHHTGELSKETLPRMNTTNERIKMMKSI